MNFSSELLDSIHSLDGIIQYIRTHSLSTILIALGVILSPFFLRALLQILWSFFMMLGQLFFKDQLRTFFRKRICGMLRRYVNENLDITETPNWQTNMITLYGIIWVQDNVRFEINRAEVRIDLGATIRQYLRLWIRHLFSTFDYKEEQKALLCNCIKDIRLSRSDITICVNPSTSFAGEQLAERVEEKVQHAVINLGKLRKLRLNISFDSGELLLRVGQDVFRLQNFFGMVQNIPEGDLSRCNVRFGCIYDGENISLTSLDDNLEHFMLMVSDLYFSQELWRALGSCYSGLPGTLQVSDGKFCDVRIRFAFRDGRPVLESFDAKVDEGKFSYKSICVDDLEISMASADLQKFEVKKLKMLVNDRELGLKGHVTLDKANPGEYRSNFFFTETNWSLDKDVSIKLLKGLNLQTLVNCERDRITLEVTNYVGVLQLTLPSVKTLNVSGISGMLTLSDGKLLVDRLDMGLNNNEVRLYGGHVDLGSKEFAVHLAVPEFRVRQIFVAKSAMDGVIALEADLKGDLDDSIIFIDGVYSITDLRCHAVDLPESAVIRGKIKYDGKFMLTDNVLVIGDRSFNLPVAGLEDGSVHIELPDFWGTMKTKLQEWKGKPGTGN